MPGPMPPIPGVLQLAMHGSTPGEIWENIYYYQYSGPAPTGAQCTAFANNMSNGWFANMSAECPSPIKLVEVVCTDMASNTGAQGTYVSNLAGTRGDDVIGSNTAMLVSYPVSLRFRGGHFRNYLLVGGNADNQDGMNWHDAFVAEVQQHHNGFLQAFVGTTQGSTTITGHCGVRRHGRYLPNGGPPAYVLNNPLVVSIPANTAIYHKQMASQKGRIGRRSK